MSAPLSRDTLRFGSVSGTMLARVSVLVCGLVTGIATARALGPEGRGQYFAVTTVAAIIAQAANLGLSSSNVFLGARDHARIRPLLANSIALAVALALVGVGAVGLWGAAAGRLVGVPPDMLRTAAVIGAAALLWTLATSLLVATERFAALNLWQVVNALAAVAAIVACTVRHASPAQFALALALAATLCAVALAAFIAAGAAGPLRASFALVREGVGFAARAYLALLFGYLLQRTGASLLVATSTVAELGQYSIASQVFDVLLIVPGSISLVLYPLLVRRQDDLWHHVRRTAILTTVSMLVLCALAAVAAPVVLPWVFGARYANSTRALWALLPAVMAQSMVSVLSQYLVARSFPWSVVMAWAVGLAVAVGAGLALTPALGAVGAGLGQSCGMLLVCGLIVAIAAHRTATRGALR